MNTISNEWIMILMLLAIVVPFIFYLITLQNTLAAIAIESRMMAPGQVWLLLVPLFNIVWQFILINRMADSIKNECLRLNIPVAEERPTFVLGLTMTLLYLGSLVLNQSSMSDLLGSVAALAALVCWIIYWVKINRYKNLIIANRDNFLLDVEREAMQG
ncbi:hypothetical protein [Agriterribacter sp.]|uniref:hypothetical protein n=1 Tax=Agriterribacter sp. TaxID=2821509 RepID=UPI002C7FB4DA|nr:hypothetical protein [Agriterribacter sp.]HRO45977.1 hypothetical protein [Agriterribacter sp.]